MSKPSFNTCLERYAELVVRVGLSIGEGNTLWINANLDSAPFARLVAQKAYQAGAKKVHMDWLDEASQCIMYEHAPEASLGEAPLWRIRGMEELMENGGAFLQIYAPNPELLKGIDPERVALSNKTMAQAMQGFRSYIYKGTNVWGMASVPTPAWAAKVFPELPPQEAMDAMWDLIFQVNRIYEEDPVTAWRNHLAFLAERVDILNAKRYRELHYRGPGTDLRIELPEGHIWKGAVSETPTGISYVPNMPTEEVFTLPSRGGVNGTVSSTLPLNYSGHVISGFTLTFENGRVTDFTAEEGGETLKSLLDMDEGARYLGEVALVPQRSPIAELGIIFYNTMFDENASCHLAIGNAYPYTLEGGTDMTKEELLAHGANSSMAHVDFMIGSGRLDIDGITVDGNAEPLFRNGNWV